MEDVVDDSAVVSGEEHPIEETTVRPRAGDSSDSDSERRHEAPTVEALRAMVYRIFGRERPVHEVLGGGKPADLILWRNKKVSAAVLGGATLIWVLFELIEYHLLQLVCHCLIFGLTMVFLWSNAISLMHKSPPKVPEVHISEDLAVNVALVLKTEINWALAVLRDIASGRNLKKFLVAIAGLWVLSIFGNCCNFLTLFYIVVILLHTVPVLYEKYDDKVDSLAEKAMSEFRKQYAVVDAKFLRKIPRGPLKDKRQ